MSGLQVGHVLPLLEGQPVELVGGIEDAVIEHLVELEILLQLVAIDRKALLADLLGVEIPVGRSDLEVRSLGRGEGADVGRFGALLGSDRGRQAREEIDRGLTGLRHLIVERVIGPVRLTEQRRFLRPQLSDLADDRPGVVGVALFGAVDACIEQRLAGRVAAQRIPRRLLGRVLQRQQVAVELARLGRFGRRSDLFVRQAGQRGLVGDVHGAGLGGGEQLLGEVGLKRAQPLVHRLELGLLGRRQLRARMHEQLVIDIEQLCLLGVEVQLRLVILQVLHPTEQLGVQIDEVVVRGEQRRGLGVGRLERVVGVGAIDCREGEIRPLE